MNIRENYINKYSLAKTLKFSLIPQGKTLENIEKNNILNNDNLRAENYKTVKRIIDRKHKFFIESVLNNFKFDEQLTAYYKLYKNKNRDTKAEKEFEKVEENLRKQVANAFTKNKDYKNLFGKELFDDLLYSLAQSDDEINALDMFANGFTTYFSNFNKNRQNMYSNENKSTAICYRLISQNLPKFIDNILAFKKIQNSGLSNELTDIQNEFEGLGMFDIQDVFTIDYYNFTLSQSGIDRYNNFIGGYSNEDGSKAQGINERINLYNQQHKDAPKLPLLKPLFKQILSDRESISFAADKFDNDNETLENINRCFDEQFFSAIENLNTLFANTDAFKLEGIYIKNGMALSDISNGAFKSWNVISDKLNEIYDSNSTAKNKTTEKYLETRKKYFKSIKSFSIDYINSCLDDPITIVNYLAEQIKEKTSALYNVYNLAKHLIENKYDDTKKLANDEDACEKIKNLLDSVIELKNFIKPLLGEGKEAEKDEIFYGQFEPAYQILDSMTLMYNKVRNYLTQKPYSTEKIKLNFNNQELLNGWDANKETAYLSILLEKDGYYYLAIMDKNHNKSFNDFPDAKPGESVYKKMVYKLLPGPNKMLPKVFFSNKCIDYFNPSQEIISIYEKGSHKKGDAFNINDCHKLINFFKESIQKHEEWSKYDFKFSDTNTYKDIGGFYKEVEHQGYKITYADVSESYIDSLVDEGKLYLFKIYNKDFSEHSKGTPNLHTLYFKMLFDEHNLKDVVYKLNGGGEIFFRKASIKDTDIVVHKKNEPIKNKNVQNEKETSEFEYDIIKDRRYTVDKFQLHIPISLNFKAENQEYINESVRKDLKQADDVYVIGIDRGERNLIYISVVSPSGEIVEQYSLNEIVNQYNGNTYRTNYHKLLDYKEKSRDAARKEWKTIENIKELKEGYLSQVVHKIVQLMTKYNAIIVLEDLNSGMKNSRLKVEKQVYQKFENMLIEKLKYCVDKTIDFEENGGLLKAFQLVNKSINANQNGFIFYIPAWNTSKIDPVTGFVNLFDLRKKSISETKKFIETFDRISYNKDKNYFEFVFDYHNFGGRALNDYQRNWTICTYGERIETFRNKEKNSEWDNKTIVLTSEYKNLFNNYSIDYSQENLIPQIIAQTEGTFFKEFMRLFKLTVQMRNSVTNSVKPEEDYMISPISNKAGEFYDSRDYIGKTSATLPIDADANGAYNIARKGLWVIEQFKKSETDEDLKSTKISISNKEWLEYVQK